MLVDNLMDSRAGHPRKWETKPSKYVGIPGGYKFSYRVGVKWRL